MLNPATAIAVAILLHRLDLFRTLQSRAVLGPSQYLTAHMRAVLVDWCVEVWIGVHTEDDLDFCLVMCCDALCGVVFFTVVFRVDRGVGRAGEVERPQVCTYPTLTWVETRSIPFLSFRASRSPCHDMKQYLSRALVSNAFP